MPDLLTQEFVIFDVETTGLSPSSGDRIVEIAAIKTKGFQPINRFHSLVNPGRPISFAAYEVNRISDQMVAQAPQAQDVLPDFLKFVGQAVMIGHNVRFDLGFLYHELGMAQLHVSQPWASLDTMLIARRVLPQLSRYPLWLVASSLGIKEHQQHRAAQDVELTFQVFCRLMKLAKDQGILEEFLDL